MHRRLAPAVLVATIAVTAFVVAAPLASAAGTATVCGSVGAHWSLSGHSGALYAVNGSGGASCSLALKWVPKLIKERPPAGSAGPLAGPAGWTCRALNYVTGHVAIGLCHLHGNVAFQWAPKT
jgi:hypothetical protein